MHRLFILALVLVAACGAGDSTAPNTGPKPPVNGAIVGTYQLVTFNGRPLASTVVENGVAYTETITGEAEILTIADNGAFDDSTSFELSLNGSTPTLVWSTVNGTWRRSQDSVTFTHVVNGVSSVYFSGVFTGSGFTLTDRASNTYAYSRD